MAFHHSIIHSSWQTVIEAGLQTLPEDYRQYLTEHDDWLPGQHAIFNAFSLAKSQVRYVLLGESPYPRQASANGYAFWDNAVDELWSATGLAKAVNRATSLRNWLKMLLVAEGVLTRNNVSQTAIAKLDKSHFVSTLADLFHNFLKQGFLLLNATPVLSPRYSVAKAARYWQPFLAVILTQLSQLPTPPRLLLFGNIAKQLATLPVTAQLPQLHAPHPYNLSFMQHDGVLSLFSPLRLLSQKT